MLEEAERACQRIGGLVGEMNDLSRLEANTLTLATQDVDLGQLLGDVASRMHEGEDRGVRLEVRPAPEPALVAGDRARLAEAISALIRSAMRERTEGSLVTAECLLTEDDGANWALVTIGDTSVTPSLAAARHALPPFDEWIGGVGLALPVARRIIEAHGGALWSADGSQSRAASAFRLPVRR
jgi:signal transduction histidine kinase